MNSLQDKIIRLPSVQERTGLSRSTIYAKIKSGTFPKQIKLGQRASGFIESEIDGWINSQIETSRATAQA